MDIHRKGSEFSRLSCINSNNRIIIWSINYYKNKELLTAPNCLGGFEDIYKILNIKP